MIIWLMAFAVCIVLAGTGLLGMFLIDELEYKENGRVGKHARR